MQQLVDHSLNSLNSAPGDVQQGVLRCVVGCRQRVPCKRQEQHAGSRSGGQGFVGRPGTQPAALSDLLCQQQHLRYAR